MRAVKTRITSWFKSFWAKLNPKAQVVEVWTADIHHAGENTRLDIVTLNVDGYAHRISVPVGKYQPGKVVSVRAIYRQADHPFPSRS